MRNMSFSLTKQQIVDQTKTVTRRQGWTFLKSGDLIQPVEKCMGLKKGEKIKKIGCPIRIISVQQQSIDCVTPDDVNREGFVGLTPIEFIGMFCRNMKCGASDHVTRIEFEYTLKDVGE